MLKQEHSEQTPSVAAQAHVTPDELNAAPKALEDKKADTVAIGSVVDELRLNATPEQIWEQVQQQREQTQQTAKPAAAVTTVPARRRLRSWRDIKGWVWVVFWCSGGLGLFSGLSHLVHVPHDATYLGTTVVTGDDDEIILQGYAKSLSVFGDENTLRGDVPKTFRVEADGNDVKWTETKPHPVAPHRPSP